jgi:hypothetical protein
MTQQIINLGAAPNDGDGDNLRTAFDKVNDNFSNVWAQGPVDSNVQIQGNTISTLQVNQDLALSPNGTGNIRLNNNAIPGANNTWFLGSTTNQWRGVYANSITVGNITINNNLLVPGDVTVEGNLTVEGDTIQIGNIVTDTKTIQLANTAASAAAANGSGITVGANDDIATMLYSSASNVWAMNIGISLGGNVTLPTGNIRSLSTVGTGLALYANTENSQQYTALSIGNTTTQVNGIISVFDAGGTGSAGATISLSDGVGGSKTWFFNPSGITQLPGNLTTSGNITAD